MTTFQFSHVTHILSYVNHIVFLKDSVAHVEKLLKKQEDFEKMLMAHGEKFEMLKKITKVKEAFVFFITFVYNRLSGFALERILLAGCHEGHVPEMRPK